MGLGLTGVPLVDFLVLTVTILFAVLYFTNKKDPRYPPGYLHIRHFKVLFNALSAIYVYIHTRSG